MTHWRKCNPLRQILFIDGGIARLIEHCVEQYHQVVRRYDLSYCRARSLERQAEVRSKLERRGRHPHLSYCRAGSLEKQSEIRSKFERRGRHPRVKMSKKRLQDMEKKRQHKRNKQLQRAAVKKEKREKALEEVQVKLEKMSAEEADGLMQ